MVGLVEIPDELVLRIVMLTGSACAQMRSAFALGGTCRRLRRVLLEKYLPSLVAVSQDGLNALALRDPGRATAALLAMLGHASSIRRFALQGFPPSVLTASCFGTLARTSCGSLKSVNLSYSYLSDDCVRPLLVHCGVLEELSLASCAQMTGSSFDSSVSAPLGKLDLSYMHQLSPIALGAVSSLDKVRDLKLTGCGVVNSIGLETLASGPIARQLQNADLKCCPVGDDALLSFVARCPKLQSLTLARHHDNHWETGQYTDAALHAIQERFPAVKVVIEN